MTYIWADVSQGQRASSAAINGLGNEVEAHAVQLATAPRGEVARAMVDSVVSANSTTEVVAISATFTAIANRRYKATLTCAYQGTVAADIIAFRLRWIAGSTLTVAGSTQFRICAMHIPVINSNHALSVVDRATGVPAGTVTMGVTIARNNGTGTVQINGSAGLQESVLLIEEVGA